MARDLTDETMAAEARRRGVSRQWIWQERKKAEGVCITCGGPLQHFRLRCDRHAVAMRQIVRRLRGFRSNAGGGPGRKQFVPDVLAQTPEAVA